MGEVISNLKARFSVENSDFRKGLSENERALNDLDRKVWKSVDAFKAMFTPLALLAGVGGAFALLKKSINEVEGPADRFEAVIGGGKEALFEFQRALGSMDFSNFFQNLAEGFERGKQFTEALDELADKAAYNDYKIASLTRESNALQEIAKDKTKELKVRADAAEKILAIEEKIKDRKAELANEEYDIVKKQWESRNKMEADEAVKLYETIDNLSEDVKAKLDKAFDWQIGLFGTKQGTENIVSGQSAAGMLAGIPQDVIKSYADYLNLIDKGEKDVLIKLFNSAKDFEEKISQAQERYNGIVAQTTRLLPAEDKQLNKNLQTTKQLNKERELDLIKRASTSNIQLPDFKYDLSGLNELKQVYIPLVKELGEVEKQINGIIERAAENMLVGFGEWLGAFSVGMAGFRDLRQMVGNAFGDMLIQLGTVAIEAGVGIKAIKTAFESMNPAVAIAAGIALIAFGSAIKNSISKINADRAEAASASGSGESNKFIYDTRGTGSASVQPQTIIITGKLKAEGSDLVYVFNQESMRRDIVT
ncbi:MAG: hypothetical protein NTW82_14025 [Bacteroidia bacterium]|nr:hypothetical protein [Bacteroidia bacterium]